MAQKLKNKAVSNPIFGPSLLQRRQQNEQYKLLHSSSQPHLNFADVARHDAGKDTRLPPEGHTRSGRHSMTRHGREAEHDARSLSGPQRGLHVDDGWWALMKRGMHLLHVKPPRNDLERGIDLCPQPPPVLPLHDGNAPNPAEEAIVIFESQGSACQS